MPVFSVKDFKADLNARGAFFTPPELALFLKALLPDTVSTVYDPTCGSGSLLSAFGDEVEKYGQEIDANSIEYARSNLINFHGAHADTLTAPAFLEKKFDAIIANPPFSTKWEWKTEGFDAASDHRFSCAPALAPKGKADYAFILHCLHYLSDEGAAAILCFPGIMYRGNAEGKIRQWLVEQGYINKVIEVEGGKFEDTTISTVALVIKKKPTDKVTFVRNGKERAVDIEEIRSNGFILSPSTYIVDEIKKVEYDPLDLEESARRNVVRKLKTELEVSALVCSQEGWNTLPAFLDELQAVIDSYRT